jgi:hypothetical protein
MTLAMARAAGLLERRLGPPVAGFHQYHGSSWLSNEKGADDKEMQRELPSPKGDQIVAAFNKLYETATLPGPQRGPDDPVGLLNPWLTWGLGTLELDEHFS